MKHVLIGLSWPYANGRLHIGGMASSLPADVIARYHRNIGNKVSFVTGSDCYGTPILVAAGKEGITPTELANKYHEFHANDFKKFGFSFDRYDKTLSDRHHEFVKKFHEVMYRGGYIAEKTAPQLYCEKCGKFLPDRYVEGLCPHCKKPAKGDSCDNCGKILEPEDLIAPKCILCGSTPTPKSQTHMYLELSKLQSKIQKFFDERKANWTPNAVGMTQRYLTEGLRDRAITRSLAWGIDIPRAGWEDRKIYIWAENVLGYFAASEPEFFVENGKTDFLHYYVHGKDNIPFHSIILPGLIFAHGNGVPKYHLPDKIIAFEYVNVGGEKISKSKGNQIFAHTMHENFDMDMVRYYLLRIISDKRDSNFTIEEFVNVINGELVNNFGNLVNRTLSFVKTRFDNQIPRTETKFQEVKDALREYHEKMPAGDVSGALKAIMDLVNFGNKYFADKKPWVNEDANTIAEVISIIRASAEMLDPFIPTAAGKVKKWLSGDTLPEIEILWQRLELPKVKAVFDAPTPAKNQPNRPAGSSA